MNQGERLKYIRKDLKMSQEKFGESLGVTRDVINNLERDRNKSSNEAMLRLICKTYNVNYFWLTEEDGEPYVRIPEIIIDTAVEKYELDKQDKKIIEEYVKLDPKVRKAFKEYLNAIFLGTPD